MGGWELSRKRKKLKKEYFEEKMGVRERTWKDYVVMAFVILALIPVVAVGIILSALIIIMFMGI